MTASYAHLKHEQQHIIAAFQDKLPEMTEAELAKACEEYIWLSAFASNNGTSAYHWMCDFTHDECVSRNRVDIYNKAHARLMAEAR